MVEKLLLLGACAMLGGCAVIAGLEDHDVDGGRSGAGGGAGGGVGAQGTTGAPASSASAGGASSATGGGAVGSGGAGSCDRNGGAGGGPGAFPSTPILDCFDRPDGDPGADWTSEPLAIWWLKGGRLTVPVAQADTSTIWNAEPFGADQEVHVTLRKFGSKSFQLLLKQEAPGATCNRLYLSRDFVGKLELGCCKDGGYNEKSLDVPLAPGDQLGARVDADGVMTAYVNHVVVGAFQPLDCLALAQGGGFIGLGANPQDVELELDDFGGGDAK